MDQSHLQFLRDIVQSLFPLLVVKQSHFLYRDHQSLCTIIACIDSKILCIELNFGTTCKLSKDGALLSFTEANWLINQGHQLSSKFTNLFIQQDHKDQIKILYIEDAIVTEVLLNDQHYQRVLEKLKIDVK